MPCEAALGSVQATLNPNTDLGTQGQRVRSILSNPRKYGYRVVESPVSRRAQDLDRIGTRSCENMKILFSAQLRAEQGLVTHTWGVASPTMGLRRHVR